MTGEAGMVGETGVAKSDIHQDGKVSVHGEFWNAVSAVPIGVGSKVRVVGVHGLKVQVEAEKEKS